MRPLETAIPVLLLIYLLWPHPRAYAARLLPAAALILTLLHFLLEGYRWQMIPLYVLTAMLGISALLKIQSASDWKPLGSYLTIILLAASTALPVLLPVPAIPRTSGPFHVGTRRIELLDGSRRELYSGRNEPRRFIVQLWYPADPGPTSRAAPWMQDAGVVAPAIAQYLHLPAYFLDHLTLVKTPAYLDADIAASESGFPVILFSHGWNGFAAQNTVQAIELASHGYVVAAVNHTYGAITTVFDDGTVAPNNPAALPAGAVDEEYELAARTLVDQWAGDMLFTLQSLASSGAGLESSFLKALDLHRVGVFGHSTGGGAAIEFCGREALCRAVVGLDPFMRPVSAVVLEKGLSQPALFMFSAVWADDADSPNNRLFFPFYEKAKQPLGVAAIAGTRHYDFSDLPMLSPIAPQLGLKGTIPGKQMVQIMNRYLLAFFDQTLRGRPAELLNTLAAEFPEVRIIR